MSDLNFKDDALYFIPLGGSGEFGVNLNLFGYKDRWIMVDCGMGFADDSMPGVDILLPDPEFIAQRRDRLLGMIITHGHEDHIGAIVHLWPRLQCPLYATPFTAGLIRAKLKEAGLIDKVKIQEVQLGGRVQLEQFGVQYFSVAHSIPEPNLLVIETPVGNIVHTGDWKFDDRPVIGTNTEIDTLRDIGSKGVLALLGDSTNAATPGRTGSESDVIPAFTKIFGQFKGGVAVTSFASHVGRLRTIAKAAKAVGRNVALVGRSLHRINEVARATGYMNDIAPFVRESEAAYVAKEEMVWICTGSQGEPRSALARLADGSHPHLELAANDVAVFSARCIPGNEKDVSRVQTNLRAKGVHVVTDADELIHVSGHPSYDDVVDLLQALKPKVLIPVHGEVYQLQAHAKIGEKLQIPQVLVPQDGQVIRLTPTGATVAGEVHHGVLCLEGKKVRPIRETSVRGRQKVAENGIVFVALALDKTGSLAAEPTVDSFGLFNDEERPDMHRQMVEAVITAVEDLDDRTIFKDHSVEQAARIAARRLVKDQTGFHPPTEVKVMRV